MMAVLNGRQTDERYAVPVSPGVRAGRRGWGMARIRAWWMHTAAIGASVMLAGCGGGGGVNSTPTPVSTPTPDPTPTPTPTPTATPTPTVTTSYDTAEYRATVGATSMNALAGYNAGATGKGVVAAVIDSGIDTGSAEFGDRISPASQNVAGGSGIVDASGHGTAVAFTLAGRMNGTGTEGVAFDSTVLVLRADTPGTCTSAAASTSTDGSNCSFNDDNIARGVDLARTNGARVVNISLGGADAASNALIAAINRATAAGIVIVIAAGNDGTANPEASAEFANNAAVSRNLVIVAGSVGANSSATAGADAISSFSNRAGDTAQHYLAAVGERVRAPDQTGTAYLWSGTSFATPQIAGAVALLAQAFPNLTGAQIVNLLFSTARDAGDAGVDSIYGQGVLDLTKAFQPAGTVRVAGSKQAVSTAVNGTLSAPMGDATSGALGAVILDGYSRAFSLDLAQTLRRAQPQRGLAAMLQSTQRNVGMSANGMSVSLTLAPRINGDVGIERTTLTSTDAQMARAIAGTVTQRLGSGAAFGFAFASGASGITAQLAGQSSPAFLVARDDGTGFGTAAKGASALRQQFGAWGVSVEGETGAVLSPRDVDVLAGAERWRRTGYARYGLSLDRHFGALATLVTASRLDEHDTVLGASFGSGLGGAHASSWFVDAAARFDMGAGWSLGGSMRQGWTGAALRSDLSGSGALRTDSYAADIGKDGVFGHDSVGLRVAQPLRVAHGGLDLALPTAYDYASAAVTGWTTERLNLSPTGREVDVEARYSRPLYAGSIQTNLFWRRDPGNVAALAPDYGLAVRYALGF